MRLQSLLILMGLTTLSPGIFPATIAPTLPPSHPSILAQKGPPGTVGQVPVEGAIRLVIMNQTSVALWTGISGGTRVELPPQGKNTFVFDSAPVNVFVYPVHEAISLKFDTSVRANIVTIQVTQQVGAEPPGDAAINIKPSGEIYLY